MSDTARGVHLIRLRPDDLKQMFLDFYVAPVVRAIAHPVEHTLGRALEEVEVCQCFFVRVSLDEKWLNWLLWFLWLLNILRMFDHFSLYQYLL
jgi:hypothetical protein